MQLWCSGAAFDIILEFSPTFIGIEGVDAEHPAETVWGLYAGIISILNSYLFVHYKGFRHTKPGEPFNI